MKPKTELFLRQSARWICLAAAAAVLTSMLTKAFATLLSIPPFITILKILTACSVALAAVHLWLAAVGMENKSRIEELKKICENQPK